MVNLDKILIGAVDSGRMYALGGNFPFYYYYADFIFDKTKVIRVSLSHQKIWEFAKCGVLIVLQSEKAYSNFLKSAPEDITMEIEGLKKAGQLVIVKE